MVKILQILSGLELFVGSCIIIVAVGAVGLIANAVLRDLGFGTAGNGLLVFAGFVGGAYVRSITIGF